MDSLTTAPSEADEPNDPGDGGATQREHLRGSSLMVVGRVISMGLNLIVQVVTVRYLGKTDYGIFAYAVSVSSLGASAALFGQEKALGRFLPSYELDEAHGRSQGAIVVAFGTVFGIGASIAAAIIGLHAVGIDLTGDEQAVTALLIMISLAPVLALDSLFVSLFAVVAKPTAIFFRRHVLTPSLRLISVLAVIATAGAVETLAWAYLISGVVGLLAYALMLIKVVRSIALGQRHRREYPMRDMWGFGAPMVVSDVVQSLRTTLVVVFLEALRSVDDVGAYRAVVPIAQVNLFAMQSFRLLYLPLASRLHARRDLEGLKSLYWQSAAWIAVGTFPIFVLTFSFADPLTRLLFGDEFASSATILAVLAAGLYVNAALGLNALTLKAAGNVRAVLAVDGFTAVAALGLNLWLIATWGALGAAVSATAILLIQNLLVHIALSRVLGGLALPRAHRVTYLSVTLGAMLLLALQSLADPPIVVSVVAGLATVAFVLIRNRRVLDLAESVPELARIPILRRLVQ